MWPWMLPVICAAALASDGLKAALPVVIRGKLHSEPVTAGLLSVLALACFMFSLSMALGSATGTRANATADRQQQASTYASAKGAVDGVEAEIQKIGAQRGVAEIEAAQAAGEGVTAKVWIQTAKCTDITRTASQQACAMWLDLAKEKALSARLADLKASLPGLQAKLTGLKAVATGDDPQVVALQNVAGLFGLALPADKVAGWLSVLLVLILELGATLGPLAGGSTASGRQEAPQVVPSAPTATNEPAHTPVASAVASGGPAAAPGPQQQPQSHREDTG